MTKKISEKEREKTVFKKEKTVFKKAYELSVFCGIELCLISYGVNGEINTFPEEQERVANLARRFTDLDETSRHKRTLSFEDINVQKMKKKKEDSNLESEFDYYSSDQLKLALESIDRKLQSIYEALEIKNKKNSHGNAASSEINPPDLVFGNSYSNSIFDDIGEDDEFNLPLDFGFIDLKEVDYMLEHYHVEQKSWNQEAF